MGRLPPLPRLKMYLIQLVRPPSTLNSIVLCRQHAFVSCCILPLYSLRTLPTCSSLSMLPVATCVQLSRSEFSLVKINPKLIELCSALSTPPSARWHRNSLDVTHSVRLSADEIKHPLVICEGKNNVSDINPGIQEIRE
jgi:hypothetical protein